jgi:hypothetical protein
MLPIIDDQIFCWTDWSLFKRLVALDQETKDWTDVLVYCLAARVLACMRGVICDMPNERIAAQATEHAEQAQIYRILCQLAFPYYFGEVTAGAESESDPKWMPNRKYRSINEC